MKSHENWLLNPIILEPFEESKDNAIEKYGFKSEKYLRNLGVQYLFPVQATVISMVMKYANSTDSRPPGDLCVSAATGSGKTLAYAIPITETLANRIIPRLRALVVVPTRDLSKQVFQTFNSICKLNVVQLGNDVVKNEKEKLGRADIVVTTPGKLMDHLDWICFDHLRFLVIDEADRILNQRFHNWFERLKRNSQAPMQKLLFSATLTHNPAKLGTLKLTNPVYISESTKYQLPSQLEEILMKVPISHKPLALITILKMQTVVFVNSLETLARLEFILQQYSVKVASISSEKYPSIRQKKLSLFEKGEIECLICTDISTRGIDFNVPQVVNYDLPVNSKTYIHRVGRTARKNQQGTAITLLADNQVKLFKKMINNIPREGRMRRTLADEEEMKLLEGKFEQVLSLMKDKFGSNRIRKATEEISFNPVKKLKMAPLSDANSESKSSDSSSESEDSNDAEIAKSPDSLYVDLDGTPAFAPFGHPAWML